MDAQRHILKHRMVPKRNLQCCALVVVNPEVLSLLGHKHTLQSKYCGVSPGLGGSFDSRLLEDVPVAWWCYELERIALRGF